MPTHQGGLENGCRHSDQEADTEAGAQKNPSRLLTFRKSGVEYGGSFIRSECGRRDSNPQSANAPLDPKSSVFAVSPRPHRFLVPWTAATRPRFLILYYCWPCEAARRCGPGRFTFHLERRWHSARDNAFVSSHASPPFIPTSSVFSCDNGNHFLPRF